MCPCALRARLLPYRARARICRWVRETACRLRPPRLPIPTGEEEQFVDDDVKVLLIEDDVAAAEMYRLRLVADGYSVVIARDGQEGLRMATDEAPDFIYLDLRLPGLDGFEVLERLRAGAAT